LFLLFTDSDSDWFSCYDLNDLDSCHFYWPVSPASPQPFFPLPPFLFSRVVEGTDRLLAATIAGYDPRAVQWDFFQPGLSINNHKHLLYTGNNQKYVSYLVLEYEENGHVTTIIEDSQLESLSLSFGYQLVNSNGEPIATSSVNVSRKNDSCDYPQLRKFIANKEKLEEKFDRYIDFDPIIDIIQHHYL
jgi:hypothetical protein